METYADIDKYINQKTYFARLLLSEIDDSRNKAQQQALFAGFLSQISQALQGVFARVGSQYRLPDALHIVDLAELAERLQQAGMYSAEYEELHHLASQGWLAELYQAWQGEQLNAPVTPNQADRIGLNDVSSEASRKDAGERWLAALSELVQRYRSTSLEY
jgi:uncharacterized protein YidB (DUF937 family)